jgi:hypothetical protein
MTTIAKTASGNYCKTLSSIPRSDQKLDPFSPFILVWRDRTFTSLSRDSIATTKKMESWNSWHDDTCSSLSSASFATKRKIASPNYCKTLSTIQRSDQKLELYSLVTLVYRDWTFASQSRDSIGTTRKMASRNSCKNSGVIQRSDQTLRRF